MSRLIVTIENENVTEEDDKSVHWTAKAAIDGDGTGPSHGDPDYQSHTSYKPDLNSDVDRYIVVPPAIINGVEGIVMGCQATVTNTTNGSVTDAVVGDIGPHRKLGEISIATASAIGVDPSPTSGGIDEHVIQYVIWPGQAANVNGVQYTLQPSHPA